MKTELFARFSQRHRFADWPCADVPAVAAGVYAIWEGQELIYCGMSGRQFEVVVSSNKQRYGLCTRLASHASGRLSGDQFCVYVANRLVIPALSHDQLHCFKSGDLNLDALTKHYVRERLDYQFTVVTSSGEAFALERECRAGVVFGMRPTLNPL
ncbi:hypothetical protein [Rivibacter subsaxonicus]|uniref:hypothetical protein n=1 Tax=Rivibacter subsaxonicus TaxID=457575 RepID=UPI00102AD524|nr:hypothetical protein [Rivibacter subsaxonicus]